MTEVAPEDDDYDPDLKFLSLDEVVDYRIASCAVLASYIEQHGVDGWDRYGRYKSFDRKTDEAEVAAALDFVAECQSRRMQLGGEWKSDIDWPPWSMRRFGWLMKDLPDFEGFPASVEPTRDLPMRPSPKRDGNHLRIIGALMGLLLKDGAASKSLPKSYASQAELINKILEVYPPTSGISKRNLEDTFALVRKMFDQKIGSPQIGAPPQLR